jgi:hypothetical protein
VTPAPWTYGVRKDGSIWMSFGDPTKGEHHQFDFGGSEADARLVCAAPDLLLAAKESAVVIAEVAKAAGIPPSSGTCLHRLMAAVKKAQGK